VTASGSRGVAADGRISNYLLTSPRRRAGAPFVGRLVGNCSEAARCATFMRISWIADSRTDILYCNHSQTPLV